MITVKGHMHAFGTGSDAGFYWSNDNEWTFEDAEALLVFQRKLSDALLELGEAGAAMGKGNEPPKNK